MKNKIVLLIFFLVATLFSNAQEKLSETDQGLLREQVKLSAENTKSIVSDFVQEKHLSVLTDVVKSEGKMVFLMPDKIRWEYTSPSSNIAIFKENKLFVNDNGKKNSFDLDSNKIFKSFNSLIVNSIKGDMFDEEQFEISYFTINGEYLIRFVPKEKRLKKLVSAFELIFDKGSAEVKEIKLIESPEDYTIIKFLNRRSNLPVDESAFDQ